MKKTIIISENQLIKALGVNEEFMGYFSTGDDPVGGTHETNVDGVLGDGDVADSEPYDSTKFDWEAVRQHNMLGIASDRHSPIVSMAEGKKKISESNSGLKNLNIYAKVTYDNPNIPDEEYSGSEDAQEMRRLRAQRSGDKEKADAINIALHQRRDPINNSKEYRKNVLHQDNVYQKKGGRKTGTGTAHTKKNQSITSM